MRPHRARRGCVVVLMLFLLSGWILPPSLPAGYLFPQQRPPSNVISRRVLLVADNQLHNVYSEPVPILRSGLADRFVRTAIRPVQLDFYGQDFLAWLVQDQGRRTPIVHLGDTCDFSCTGEFHRFWDIMRRQSGAGS